MKKIHSAFILAAGEGTRLRPLTATIPKPLLPVFHKPLMTFAIDHSRTLGIANIACNTRYLHEAFQTYFQVQEKTPNLVIGEYEGNPISLFHEHVYLDTGGGLRNARSLLSQGTFLIHNGDILTDAPLEELIDFHFDSGSLATLLLRHEGPKKNVTYNRDNGLIEGFNSISNSLAPIFHTDRDEEAAKPDGVRQTNILTPGCMCTYCPSHNVSLTQHPSGFPVSAGDRCEICGLARIVHTDSSRGAANPDVDKEGDGLRRRLYVSYCPRSNSKLTQYPSGVRKPQQNRYEICGLAACPKMPSISIGYTGIAIIEPSFLDWIPSQGPASIIPALQKAIHAKKKISGFVAQHDYFWSDLGTPESYFKTHRRIIEEQWKPPFKLANKDLPWPTSIHPLARVASSARLEEMVVAGPHAFIDHHARVKNCILLARANISSHGEYEATILGENFNCNLAS